MSRLSLAFFATAALCAICGIQMGISDNMTMAPAHAHLNLLGWATLALMGGFYALDGDLAPVRLGWLNYLLSTAGVVVVAPSIAVLLSTTGKVNPGVIVGALLALAGMAVFLASVAVVWRRGPKLA